METTIVGLGFRVSRYPSSTLFPFLFGGLLIKKLNSRKKGSLIIKGLLGNLEPP